jgi:hypothetical protein
MPETQPIDSAIDPASDRSAAVACSRWFTLVSVITVALVTAILSVLPHGVSWLRHGEWSYWSNSDHMLYGAYAKSALQGSWHMSDPYNAASDPQYLLYSWFQFVPLPHLIGALGGGPDSLNLVWRIAGGLFFGAAAYPLLRSGTSNLPRSGWLALFATIIFVVDPGAMEGRSFVQALLQLRERLGHAGLTVSDDLSQHQFRLVTPLTNFPFFLLALWALTRVEKRPWAFAAAILLGINVLTYFFFWTALVGIIVGLITLKAIAWLADRKNAQIKWELIHLVLVLIVGLAIGLPDILTKRHVQTVPGVAEILERMCRGQKLPPGDPFRFMYAYNVTFYAKFAVMTLALAFWRSKLDVILWVGAAVGFILCNAGIWAGIEFENFHWQYVCNPLSEIALLLLAIRILARPRWFVPALGTATVGLILICGGIRAYDSAIAIQPANYRRMKAETESLLPPLRSMNLDGDTALVGPFEMDWLALHTRAFQLYSEPYSTQLTVIPEEEAIRRHALNGFLMGLNREEYGKLGASYMCTGCLPIDPDWWPENVKTARLKAFDAMTPEIAAEAIARFSNVVVLMPAGKGMPQGGKAWRVAASNDYWVLWSRDER